MGGRSSPARAAILLLLAGLCAHAARNDALAPASTRHAPQAGARRLAAAPAAAAPAPAAGVGSEADADEPSASSDWVAPGEAAAWAAAQAASVARPTADASNCPGCLADYCKEDAVTAGKYRCSRCAGMLFVSKSDGTCGCPAGKYANAENNCKDCDKGSFCLGGSYAGVGTPAKTSCTTFSAGLTTAGLRAVSKKFCVNDAGYSYSVDTTTQDPVAAPCPANTYGPGLKKQRGCVNCPSGFTTDGKAMQYRQQACVVAPGYFLKSPGQVLPCPKGEYKEGTGADSACKKCNATGVTTKSEASTSDRNCTELQATFFAKAMVNGVVTATAKCPQRFYCPGGTATQQIDPANVPAGDRTIVACPNGLWTQGMGASEVTSCLVPPGYYSSGGTTSQCSSGEYRAGWKTAGDATACDKCSPDNSIFSLAADTMLVYKPDGTEVSQVVRGTSLNSCYILMGMGLQQVSANVFKGVNCDKNNFGVTATTFGLDTRYACKDCPVHLVTSKSVTLNPISSSYYVSDDAGHGGFISVDACVTQPGWGYNGKVAAPCPEGSYNPGDNTDPCIECGYGLTTNGTQASETDCVIGPGYGFYSGQVTPCPVGTYNDKVRKDNATQCTNCPYGMTNMVEGAKSASGCNMCAAGFGGNSCTECGGDSASYGTGIRAVGEACTACPVPSGAGFTFAFGSTTNNFWSPPIVAAPAAASESDCLVQFLQISDGAWSLGMAGANDWGTPPLPADTFGDCVQMCTDDTTCQFLQFDYTKTEDNCFLKIQSYAATANPSKFEILGMKAVAVGDVKARSIRAAAPARAGSSRRALAGSSTGGVSAMGVVASGRYTFWRDDFAGRVGTQVEPPITPSTWQDCLQACNDDDMCAGVYMQLSSATSPPSTCRIIYGDTTPGTFRRSVTRTLPDTDHMTLKNALF